MIWLIPTELLAIEPPRCKAGSVPRLGVLNAGGKSTYGWWCLPSDHWSSEASRWYPDFNPEKCRPPTRIFISGQIAACVGPTPICPKGCFPSINGPSGYECVRLPDCPEGTVVGFDQFHGASCDPPPGAPDTACPMGSTWVGLCCGGCAPISRKTCEALPGWRWKSGRMPSLGVSPEPASCSMADASVCSPDSPLP